MQTQISTAPGAKLKSLIADDSKDFFEWLRKPEEREQKERLNYLVNLIEKYRELAFVKLYSNSGFENTNELVYNMLGQGQWEDNLFTYKNAAQNLLKLLANQKVAEAIKECKFRTDGIVEMADAILAFLLELERLPYRSLLLSKHLQDFGPEERSDEIDRLTEEYEIRVQVAASGKVIEV